MIFILICVYLSYWCDVSVTKLSRCGFTRIDNVNKIFLVSAGPALAIK